MKLKLTALVLTVGLVALYAQRPGRFQNSPDAAGARDGARTAAVQILMEYLGLTDSQLESLAAIRTNARTAAEPVMEEARAKQIELREAIRGGADANTIGSLEVELRDIREELQGFRENAALQAKGSLTADQQAKVAVLEAAASVQREVHAAVSAGLIAGAGDDGPGFGPGGPGGRGKGGKGGKGGPRGPGGFGPPPAE